MRDLLLPSPGGAGMEKRGLGRGRRCPGQSSAQTWAGTLVPSGLGTAELTRGHWMLAECHPESAGPPKKPISNGHDAKS